MSLWVKGVALALLVGGMPSTWAAQNLPAGWRLANDQELYMESAAEPMAFGSAQGDFDGDGQPDQALIGVGGSKEQLALLIKVSSNPDWLILSNGAYEDQLNALGAQRVSATQYSVFCTTAADGCDKDRKRIVQLPNDSILVINPYGSSLLVWDGKRHGFTEYVVGL